jgi:flagellar hook-associated protein 1 FlgK
MPGLFGALELGARSLQTQQLAVEITGQNLANVNNSAYARQRVNVQTSLTIQTSIGQQGTGAEAVAIEQMRDALLDRQIVGELSVGGYLQSEERALEATQSGLGEVLSSSSTDSGTSGGIMEQLSAFFNSFQSLTSNANSQTDRQAVVAAAEELASRLNRADARLSAVSSSLDQSVESDLKKASTVLDSIAELNGQITRAEAGTQTVANDLRDQRQAKLEELAGLVNFETAENADGSVNVAIGGTLMVSGRDVVDHLETYQTATGTLMVRSANSQSPIAVTGGSIAGTITARDETLADLRSDLDTLANSLITEVNTLHRSGYDLSGNTGEDLFTGNSAADIGVNQTIADDPKKLQISAVAGAAGDSQIALAIAKLTDEPITSLGGATYQDFYSTAITKVGEALNSTTSQIETQTAVQTLLKQQRESVSGVSLDEEMTNLIKFQQAFQASARLVSTISEMLQEVVNLKQ